MADSNNVEEFTIKYKVDTGSAAKNLHEFGEHVKKVKHEGKEGASSFAELGESFVGAASRALTAGAVIGTVMAGIAKAISATVQAMKDYNDQLELGKKSSIGFAMQTIISDNMMRANPLLTRKDTVATMQTVSDFISKAYTNPNSQNEQNGILTRMGINVFGPDGKPIDKQVALGKIAEHFKSISAEDAEAEGRRMGIAPDAAASMHTLGKSILDTSKASLEQVERQQEAAKAAEEMHKSLNQFWEDISKISRVITDQLLGPAAKLAEKIATPTHAIAESIQTESTKEFAEHMLRYQAERAKHITWKGAGTYLLNSLNPLGMFKNTTNAAPQTKEELEWWEATKPKQTAKKEEEKTNKLDKEHKEMDDFSKPIDLFNRSTNMFAQAVAAMPGSLSEQQAFAAWAGGVANAVLADAKDSSRSASGGSGGGGFINSVAKAESGNRNIPQEVVDINTQKGTPAEGYFQIITPTWKRYAGAAGVDVSKYPNAMSAPREVQAAVAAHIPMNQFGPRTQRLLHGEYGEFDKNQTLGELDKHFSGTRDSGGKVVPGRGMEDNRYDIALGSLANSLGLKNGNTLARGEEGGKDAAWALNAAQSGLGINVRKLQDKLVEDTSAGHMREARTDIQLLRKAQAELKATVDYGPEIVDKQRDKEGNRRTYDQPPNVMPLGMTVNITGVSDPHEVVKILNEQIEKTIQEQSNKITG